MCNRINNRLPTEIARKVLNNNQKNKTKCTKGNPHADLEFVFVIKLQIDHEHFKIS